MNVFAKRWLLAVSAGLLLQSPLISAQVVAPFDPSAASFVKTDSGLQYADVEVGSGPPARPGHRVTVHYTGWLKSRYTGLGKQFDSSRDSNEPFRFVLGEGGVIAGWDEGVQGMQVGGKRRLIVPAALGYGARGAGASIPPNAPLVFDIELLQIN